MFTKSSRYWKIKHVEAYGINARRLNAVFLRRIPFVDGEPVNPKGNDRLDILASDNYDDPTMFWHIADANTELQANDLIKKGKKVKPFLVPKS